MKKLLLILPLLALASCAPLLSTVQGTAATLSTDGTSVLFSNPGPQAAEDVSVVLYGPVTVTGVTCIPFSRSWICPINDVPVGKAFRLQFTGNLNNASASFYTASSGNRPLYVQLK
ncbi:hypothetical protein MF271_16800 [Deinococcus sp. KNUC1210]|uniref:hypothetical protein n=1 Tax=Deinococcus sp. KNUC1210 TaxID=2917691 RepID=UPI001EF13A74|nr:hypothetical protein [Deinococcus sp. KNUC1210]ULH15546.1 hypothetical protein MF271_16800 [Deinococcus sp. KNUC1210]